MQNIVGRSTIEDGIISPRAYAKKVSERIFQEHRQNQKLLKLTMDFIKVTDRQILYLKLLKEDQYNPWIEMVRQNLMAVKNGNLGRSLTQSFCFYQMGHETRKMRQRHSQRVKLQVDFDDKHQTIMQVI